MHHTFPCRSTVVLHGSSLPNTPVDLEHHVLARGLHKDVCIYGMQWLQCMHTADGIEMQDYACMQCYAD